MRTLVAAVLLAAAAVPAPAAVYEIDPVHSLVGFRIRHLVARTSGRFTKYSGVIHYTPGKPETWKAEAKIDAASINTDNANRDAHLRSAEFFDVEKCPEITFKSTKVLEAKEDSAKLQGELTMHCVTKPVVLDVELGGVAGPKAGFMAKTKVNRKDFGIVWNQTLDTGGFALGDEVEITLDIEADDVAAKKKKAKQ